MDAQIPSITKVTVKKFMQFQSALQALLCHACQCQGTFDTRFNT